MLVIKTEQLLVINLITSIHASALLGPRCSRQAVLFSSFICWYRRQSHFEVLALSVFMDAHLVHQFAVTGSGVIINFRQRHFSFIWLNRVTYNDCRLEALV